jgi:hypothetical protein
VAATRQSSKMPWTKKPTSFSDFVFDADGEAPILIYKATDCPPIPDAISRGSDCSKGHEEWNSKPHLFCDSYDCPLGDNCLNWLSCTFHSEEPDYFLITPPSFKENYNFPEHWICGFTQYYPYNRLDWILASAETVKRVIREKEPLACIWAYDKGPRQWSQHGGDEDWTAIVRKSVYCSDSVDLYFEECLDYCSTTYEDEEDFRVFTGAHA